jgi:hypothetical protein
MILYATQRPGYELARLPAEGRGCGVVGGWVARVFRARLTRAGTAPTDHFYRIMVYIKSRKFSIGEDIAIKHTRCACCTTLLIKLPKAFEMILIWLVT